MQSLETQLMNLSEKGRAPEASQDLNCKVGYERVKSIEKLPAELLMNVSSTTLVPDTSFESAQTSIALLDDNAINNAALSSSSSLIDNISASLHFESLPPSEPTTLKSISREEVLEHKLPLLLQDVSQANLDNDAMAASLEDSSQMTSHTNLSQAANQGANSLRHGISRYAPYGTRFAALMKDGTYKMSHIAGDLANRARAKGGKGGRVDLVLVTHKGEREQLDAALAFYENTSNKYAFGPRPGPSEVLNHLKDIGIDWDYRKGDNVKLLQRNASNFFKRMMEHARRLSHPLAESYAIPPAPANATMITPSLPSPLNAAPAVEADPAVRKAAAILTSMAHAKVQAQDNEDFSMNDNEDDDHDHDMNVDNADYSEQSLFSEGCKPTSHENQNTRVTDWSRPKHRVGSFYYEVCRNTSESLLEERDYYNKAAKDFDWSSVEDVTSAYKPNRIVLPPPTGTIRKRSYHYGYDSESDFEEFGNRGAPNKSTTHFKKQKSNSTYGSCEKSNQQLSTPRQRQPPKAFVSNGSVPSTAPQAIIRKGREGLSAGVYLKGLSRHSPYGTRFCATMPNGEKRESYLAGDLADRVRSGAGGGELLLVLHPGEIDQLQSAWEFVLSHSDSYNVGAGQVLEFLRMVGKDANHRKPGTTLLQKNAGNFFKRVQEYGKRKQSDPNYLSLTPKEQSELRTNNQSTKNLPPLSPSPLLSEIVTSSTSTLLSSVVDFSVSDQDLSAGKTIHAEEGIQVFPVAEESEEIFEPKEESQILIDSIPSATA